MPSEFQLPSGQLWWLLQYRDGDSSSEMLFTYEGENKQTWYNANQYAQILLRELGLMTTSHYNVSLWEPQAKIHNVNVVGAPIVLTKSNDSI